MNPELPKALLERPIAHRALHDVKAGRPENSLAAVQAAIDGDFGIEVDLQLSADNEAMVFHDYALNRLTQEKGALRARTREELGEVKLNGGNEGIPSLAETLAVIRGRVPILIEIKDQDGALGENVGPLESAVARELESYRGAVAVMSFNPHSVSAMRDLAPDVPRGLVTERFPGLGWRLPQAGRKDLRAIADFDRVGATFISHDVKDLSSKHVARIKARGVPILCWTVKSAAMEAKARRIADNVTFEGYLPG